MFFLKKLRANAGLTQAAFSKKIGYVGPQFISNIERGLADLPPAKFKLASKALGISIESLVTLKVKNDKVKLMKRYGGRK